MVPALSGLKPRFRRLMGDEHGATAIEYGLIAALIVLAMAGALRNFAGEAGVMYDRVSSSVADAMS